MEDVWNKLFGLAAGSGSLGRDEELAEGSSREVRECGRCRVQGVDLVGYDAGGAFGLVAGTSVKRRWGRVGRHGHESDVFVWELVRGAEQGRDEASASADPRAATSSVGTKQSRFDLRGLPKAECGAHRVFDDRE
jgi:hypothetical protein